MELPRIVKEENNPEVLKAYLSHLIQLNEQKDKIINDLHIEKGKKDQQNLSLDDALLVLRKRMFGKSSEKRGSARHRDSGKKLSIHSESLVPPPEEKELSQLTEIKVDHKLSAEELGEIAEQYGFDKNSEWECLNGLYDESTEVDIKVESYVRKKHRRFKYRLKATKGSDREVIVTAPVPLKIMPGAKYSIDLSVDVVTKKYLYHLPFERIRRMMESGGLTVATKTLYGLCFFVHCYLEDIAEKIKEEVLSCGLALHMDETKWPINNRKEDDGYMWVMSNQAGSYYQFEPTRSGKIAKELVGPYRGPVVVDGYGGYKSSLSKENKMNLSFCWAHVRRKFTDIEKNYPRECSEFLDMVDELFYIDKLAKDFDDLKKLREEKSKPLTDKMHDWLLEHKMSARGESHLRKAINYSLNHWQGLLNFIEDVRIPLSNNEAERAIRHSVMGRKNFYGSRTINGADVTATLYTIIESCKKVQLDPKFYISMAVKEKIKGKTEVSTPLAYAKKIRSKTA